jgi:hypothetical protein
VETEEDVHVEELSKLERGHVSLQDGRHLQTDDRQLVSGAQRVLVFVLVGAAVGPPGGSHLPDRRYEHDLRSLVL